MLPVISKIKFIYIYAKMKIVTEREREKRSTMLLVWGIRDRHLVKNEEEDKYESGKKEKRITKILNLRET